MKEFLADFMQWCFDYAAPMLLLLMLVLIAGMLVAGAVSIIKWMIGR